MQNAGPSRCIAGGVEQGQMLACLSVGWQMLRSACFIVSG